MEQARQKTLPRAHAGKHSVIFEGIDEKCGQKDEDKGGPQHYPGVQAILFVREFFVPNVAPNHIAHAAYHDERAYGEVYERISHIGREGGERRALYAHEVKPGIAECGDGVEHGKPYAPPRAEIGNEADHEQKRPCQLYGKGEDDYAFYQFDHAGMIYRSRRLRQDDALIQPYPPAQGEGKEGDHRHKTYAAHLDEQDNDYLPEYRPVHKRVVGDKPRHAGGGGGGEECVDIGRPFARRRGYGQR